MGRTYISQFVIFNENVFPFFKLFLDAGPRLRAEITLHPSTLVHQFHGSGLVFDHMANTSNPPDPGERL
jgi:hypothetical protein